MELTNTFSISQPVERAWEVITDLERVAPSLPGAALLGVEGDDYHGAVKITAGSMTAQYEGIARFVERDDNAHHAVLRAEGRDARGQGSAAATIHLALAAQGPGTRLKVGTDLEPAGRVAQFGRGVIADVSGKLIGPFAAQLEQEMSKTSSPAPAPAGAQLVANLVRRLTGKHGADFAFNCVRSSRTIRDMWSMTRRGGKAVVVSIGGKDDTVSFSALDEPAAGRGILWPGGDAR
jgi:carbon monoxide dehydrogenase subunit G